MGGAEGRRFGASAGRRESGWVPEGQVEAAGLRAGRAREYEPGSMREGSEAGRGDVAGRTPRGRRRAFGRAGARALVGTGLVGMLSRRKGGRFSAAATPARDRWPQSIACGV